jgi:mono/diheme cytochrome c family protein
MRIDCRCLFVPVVMFLAACTQPPPGPAAPAAETTTASTAAAPAQSPVDRGRYLVTLGGCNDCHSPKNFTAAGPEPDMARALSGHPAAEKLPAVPKDVIAPDKWGMVGNNNFTAFVGPWGISYARNLTPDQATGLGSWTEDMFIKTIRDGKHQGEGRPLLPPMPWQMYRNMTDEDLKAVFAYLRTLKPINNPVPDPVPVEKLGQ